MNKHQSIITIHRGRLEVWVSEDKTQELSRSFQANHYIRMPGILGEDLLNELHQQIAGSEWEEMVHDQIGVEVCLMDKGIVGLMNFLFNDQELFSFLDAVTGCGSIGSFTGRVYRMIPESGHYDSWHGDVGENRLLALSINLGREPYEGGVLQIRRSHSGEKPVMVPNTGFGDAILFRIAPGLEHCVTAVSGKTSKTAFAGWFRSEPDFFASLEGFLTDGNGK